MTRRLKVYVDEEHIARGKRGHANECPIALAVRDALRDSDNTDIAYAVPTVFGTRIAIEGMAFAKHTERSRRFVRRFDDAMVVKPQTFTFTFDTDLGRF